MWRLLQTTECGGVEVPEGPTTGAPAGLCCGRLDQAEASRSRWAILDTSTLQPPNHTGHIPRRSSTTLSAIWLSSCNNGPHAVFRLDVLARMHPGLPPLWKMGRLSVYERDGWGGPHLSSTSSSPSSSSSAR